jgi:hypothetical protein
MKLLPVRYPRYVDVSQKRAGSFVPITIDETIENELKNKLSGLLFKDGYDYVIFRLTGNLYIVEKNTDSSYTYRVIGYHPFQDLV